MKIGIMSDTHDHLPNLRKALEIFKAQGCRKILHAGDFAAPFVMRLFKEFSIPFTGVFGNNDGDWIMLLKAAQGIGEIKKGPVELELAGRKIALMHEPVFIDALKQSRGYHLIVSGHTHLKVMEAAEGQMLVINPGECSGYLTNQPTVVVCDLEELSAKIIDL